MPNLSENAKKIIKDLYAINGETVDDVFKRVAKEFATNDKEFELAYSLQKTNAWRPNTPVYFNAGTNHPMYSACWVVGLDDSMNSIYDIANVSRKIFQHGAGIGIPIGNLRAKDGNIYEGKTDKPPTGKSSGPISFMKLYDAVGETTKSGGRARRAAILCSMQVWHPDILEFITCKEIDGRLSNMNISVSITDNFMKSLETNTPFQLLNPANGEPERDIPPGEIWDKLTEMAWKTADPGLLFIDTINKYNPLKKIKLIETTNPCVIGDTIIAVADGRNYVSIKQLAEEGKDVPVYSTNREGKVEIKMGRNPRKTGTKKEVWKLTLDDDTYLIATPNHKILMKDMSYKELKSLKEGDSILPFTAFINNGYRQICNSGEKMSGGARRNRRQYRLIYEFYKGFVDPKQFAIHHMNYNKLDDRIENLCLMSLQEHKDLHRLRMMGTKNPYHKMTDEWKKSFATHIGEKNGRYSGLTNDEYIIEGKKLYKEKGKITKSLWKEWMTNKNMSYDVYNSFRFGSFNKFKECVIGNHKVKSIEFYGYEDVYNITVDDNHNYHIITNKDSISSSGICIKNCGEQPLWPFTSCNLSSINVAKFVKDGKMDFDALYKTAYEIMGLMDNIIDRMMFPDDRFKDNVLKYRPVGIGIMGLADAMFELDIKYDSAEGKAFAGEIMKCITTACVEKSADLAATKGSFFEYDIVKDDVISIVAEHTGNNESVMKKVRKHGVRNVQFTTCPPTGTTALTADASYGTEPSFGLVFQKTLIETGEVINIINPIFKKRFEKEEWYNETLLEKVSANGGSLKGLHGIPKKVRDVFVCAHDIKYKDRIDLQAELQKYCSSGISSTVNLPNEISVAEVSDLYKYAYEKGLKGITIYRDGCKRQQPITFKQAGVEVQSNFERPAKLPGQIYTVETGNGKLYVTVTSHNNRPVEVFLSMGKSGQLFNVFGEALGRVISIALQHGVSVEAIVKTMKGIHSDRPTWFKFEESDKRPAQILSIPDGIAKLLEKYYMSAAPIEIENYTDDKLFCSKCGTHSVILIEGCKTCLNCSESACG